MPVLQAQQKTAELLDIAGEYFARSFRLDEIRFDLKGKTAGCVRVAKGGAFHIRYNRQLLLENREDFLRRTVPHEVAHVVTFQYFGRRVRPHGPEWKQVMALFGADDSRCHHYETRHLSVRRLRQFVYVCSCQQHELSSIRHNRVQKGVQYVCRRCGDVLFYKEVV